MLYTLQLHGERVEYPIPPGLAELINDITREVLRDQPTHVYKYIANYLDTLVKVREYSKTAGFVISDILTENQELVAYVNSLGISWSEANAAAVKVQGAFRIARAKNELKRKKEIQQEKQRIKNIMASSNSIESFFTSTGVDFENNSNASLLLQETYKAYEELKQRRKVQDAKEPSCPSYHTIDNITLPKVQSVGVKQKLTRDSKVLVYEQSPQSSVISTWTTLATNMIENEAKGKDNLERKRASLVYKQDSSQRFHTSIKLASTDASSERSILPEGVFTLPSYCDDGKPGIPMISQTGQLCPIVDDDKDILTLYSVNEEDDSTLNIDFPSKLSKFSEHTPRLTKELFEIIDRRSSEVSWYIQSSESLPEGVKKQVQDVKKHVQEAVRRNLPGTASKVSLSAASQKDVLTQRSNPVNEVPVALTPQDSVLSSTSGGHKSVKVKPFSKSIHNNNVEIPASHTDISFRSTKDLVVKQSTGSRAEKVPISSRSSVSILSKRSQGSQQEKESTK